MRPSLSREMPANGLCLGVPPKPHVAIGSGFSEVTQSKVWDAGIKVYYY